MRHLPRGVVPPLKNLENKPPPPSFHAKSVAFIWPYTQLRGQRKTPGTSHSLGMCEIGVCVPHQRESLAWMYVSHHPGHIFPTRLGAYLTSIPYHRLWRKRRGQCLPGGDAIKHLLPLCDSEPLARRRIEEMRMCCIHRHIHMLAWA